MVEGRCRRWLRGDVGDVGDGGGEKYKMVEERYMRLCRKDVGDGGGEV